MENINKLHTKLRNRITKSISLWGDNDAVKRVIRLHYDKHIKDKTSCLECGCPALILATHEVCLYKGGGDPNYKGKYDFYPFQERIQKLWEGVGYECLFYESLSNKSGRGKLNTFFRNLTDKQWRFVRSGK